MHSRFDKFRQTDLGRQLEALIDHEARYIECAALSRAGVPAVAAIVHELEAKFPEVRKDQTARQFCGALVADLMRRRGHEITQARGRVSGGVFTYGAVWTPHPVSQSFPAILKALSEMPDAVAAALARFPKSLHRRRPPGTGLSPVEHACHLRDLDAEVYSQRVTRILAEPGPAFASVDGSALAEERNYRSQDLDQALGDFRVARQALVGQLSATSKRERARWGLFNGARRVTVAEVVEDIYRHDRTHLLELDELAAELRV